MHIMHYMTRTSLAPSRALARRTSMAHAFLLAFAPNASSAKRANADARATTTSTTTTSSSRSLASATTKNDDATKKDDTASSVVAIHRVGRGEAHETIAAALALARDGDVVVVAPGTYRERVVVETNGITLTFASDARVIHRALKPYEAAIDIRARDVVVANANVEHYSKSVADNYAVYVAPGASAVLERVRARSETGSGFGVDGGKCVMRMCVGSACAQNGCALFGDVDGARGSGEADLIECEFENNARDGVLARGGVNVTIARSVIGNNLGFGCEFIDCAGVVTASAIRRNKRGGVSRTNGAEYDVDVDDSNVIAN